jgi:hypothetical protein
MPQLTFPIVPDGLVVDIVVNRSCKTTVDGPAGRFRLDF